MIQPSLDDVSVIPWWHTMDLGRGIVTPGRNVPATHYPKLHLPDGLTGLRVLDIGTWDGFYAFECARRGADVLATDHYVWQHPTIGRRGFDLARAALDSPVRDLDIDVMDLTPDRVGGTFDIVLMLGVLYHMKHPLLALERAASVTKDLLVVETHIDLVDVPRPAMAFYEGSELNNDQTNWVGPNPAAVCAMLRTVGFAQTTIVHQDQRLVVHARRAA